MQLLRWGHGSQIETHLRSGGQRWSPAEEQRHIASVDEAAEDAQDVPGSSQVPVPCCAAGAVT